MRSAAHSVIYAQHVQRWQGQPIVAVLKTVTAAAMHTVIQPALEAKLDAIHAQTANTMGQKQMSTAEVGGVMCVKWTKAAS